MWSQNGWRIALFQSPITPIQYQGETALSVDVEDTPFQWTLARRKREAGGVLDKLQTLSYYEEFSC